MSINRTFSKPFACLAAAVTALIWVLPAASQEVNWDRQRRLGNLVVFQSVYEPTNYYYAPTRARVAREGGLPKFSFVRFARVDNTGDELIAGGIVHALVEIGVTDADIARAEEALSSIDGDAKLVGPIAFSSGTFSLITSVNPGDGDDNVAADSGAKWIIGTGKAPLLEGDRAAVSIALTEEGARNLWATFQTATPDISFSFQMGVDAYRSPIQATVEANWDQIYDHENINAAFRAGVDAPQAQVMLGGEIDLTYEDLKNQGAIKIVQKGEDESVEKILEAFVEDLRKIMFEPANMSGDQNFTPDYQDSAHSRASEMYGQAEESRQRRNEEMTSRRKTAQDAQTSCAGGQARQGADAANQATAQQQTQAAQETASAMRTEISRKIALYDQQLAKVGQSGGPSAEEAQRLRSLKADLEQRQQMANQVAQGGGTAANAAQAASSGSPAATGAGTTAAPGTVDSSQAAETAENCQRAKMLADDSKWDQGTQVTVSAYVSYRIKKVRKTGTQTFDMTKYKADEFVLRFDTNVGDLNQYLENEKVFVVVTSDPLEFGQKNVYVDYSGIGGTDFGTFITSAEITLRKQHQNGEVTRGNVTLSTRTIEANQTMRMAYIPKGDNNADTFEEFTYKIDWNYAHNNKIAGEWQTTTADSIPVSPPLVKKPIQFNLRPSLVDDLGVERVSIRTWGVYGERKSSGPDFNLVPDGGSLGYSASGEILLDPDTRKFEYEITAFLSDGSKRTISRTETSDNYVQIYEL